MGKEAMSFLSLELYKHMTINLDHAQFEENIKETKLTASMKAYMYM